MTSVNREHDWEEKKNEESESHSAEPKAQVVKKPIEGFKQQPPKMNAGALLSMKQRSNLASGTNKQTHSSLSKTILKSSKVLPGAQRFKKLKRKSGNSSANKSDTNRPPAGETLDGRSVSSKQDNQSKGDNAQATQNLDKVPAASSNTQSIPPV